MKRNRPIFLKINLVILVLLIPAVILYTYFSRTSLQVIDKQMSDYNESRLQFLKSQIESNAERLSFSSSVLARDSSILDLQLSILTRDYYGTIDYQTQVKEKLYLQSFSSNWTNSLSVYLPDIATRISTNPGDGYDEGELDEADNGKWRFHPGQDGGHPYYQLFIWDPYFSKDGSQTVNAVFEVRFGLDNIRKMLQHYKLESAGNCFLLTASGTVITDAAAADADYAEAGASLMEASLSELGHLNMKLDGQRTYVSYVWLPGLEAWLVDYVPLHVFHAPVIESRNLFYLSMLALIVLGFAASWLLYLHVQKPISHIIKGLKHFEMGDYSYRIGKRFHNEFDYMLQRFNDMGKEIQHLIQNVYEEQNRSRLATLKQLQAQINPHFLYNCLSFIAGCAKVGHTETIKEMAYHLGGYYRYTTRVENQVPLLREEAELVRHYLQIYSYRLERVDYGIDIPPDMMDEPVMRLILQPVVENAVMHGIEPKPGRGTVLVTGVREAGWAVIRIEDSGSGMSASEIEAYVRRLNQPMDEGTGCGLWNVHQRLKQRFGGGAGVTLEPSRTLSGLCVTLRWRAEAG
ncbi:sensor histidine kinase [Paenibacillus arenilitoris]|uniref:Histidine kinase n=1 Tax=Paenibacillus arenilitoris TaxID=2772299 RepID=A0A927H6N8_9BACL|nr:sensor histidine kinase [Paenibacillus arenilitoris]MBD2868759.1 histidine kinase [Paenibacillus arenilitoris]